jgi:hypothetical protein
MCRLASALVMSFLAALAPTAEWSQAGTPLDVAPMPDHWVPFSARMEILLPTGKRWVGRFFRGADGSTRSETGASFDHVELISIHNYTERMQYRFSRSMGWSSGLVERPPFWPKPLMMSGTMYRRLRKSEVRVEGLDLLVRVTPDSTEWIAPQLNGFVIDVQRNGCGRGCGTHFRHFTLGDPPASVFRPDPPE